VLDISRITQVLHRAGRLSDTQAALLGHAGAPGAEDTPVLAGS
jgi:hypothetical protein